MAPSREALFVLQPEDQRSSSVTLLMKVPNTKELLGTVPRWPSGTLARPSGLWDPRIACNAWAPRGHVPTTAGHQLGCMDRVRREIPAIDTALVSS